MHCCLKNGDVLLKIFTAISDLVDYANINCKKEGMMLQAMDSSKVALAYMFLRAEGFEPWKCKRKCSLGIQLENFMKLLKFMHAKDSVELNYENGDELDLVFKSMNEERVTNFSLKLMEVADEGLGIPEEHYQTCVQMSSSEFLRICRDSAQIGKTLTIRVTKEDICFSLIEEVGSGSVSIRNSTATGEDDELEATTIDCKEKVEMGFALRYLLHFTKATPLSKIVTLRLSHGKPLLVEYKIDELGYIRYYLAPKINEE